MAIYFVDGATGDDTNDGLDNVGLALATATWTEATFTLTQVGAFAAYTFTQGDLLYVSAGTGATVGLYEIASRVDNDSITLAETAQYPGVTNGSAFAAGDLATGDIVSSSGPFATIQKGFDVVAAGDTLYVKSSVTYTGSGDSVATTITDGTNAGHISVIGYASEVNDDGRFVVDGESGRTDGIRCSHDHYYWANIKFVNAVTNGLRADTSAAANKAVNILSHNNGTGIMLQSSTNNLFYNCETYSNSTTGYSGSVSTTYYFCVAHDEVDGAQALQNGAVFINCIFDTISTEGIRDAQAYCVFSGCTFYNCGTGIQGHATTELMNAAIVGCLFSTCTTAINTQGADGRAFLNVLDFCTFHNNGTDVDATAKSVFGTGDAAKGPNCISANPGFVDPANGNFTPTADAVREAAAFTFLGAGVSGVSRTFLWPGAVQPKGRTAPIPNIGASGRR
jgi:hypothetical protein